MKFNNIYRMAKVERCVDCLVKEVIEIQLCPMNFNRDGRFMLSRTRQLCCSRSGIHPARIEIRHSNISPPFHG